MPIYELRKKSAFFGVFDPGIVLPDPENPPEGPGSSYIPPGGRKSRKTYLYRVEGGRGELSQRLCWAGLQTSRVCAQLGQSDLRELCLGLGSSRAPR